LRNLNALEDYEAELRDLESNRPGDVGTAGA
jgi:hypothetical protein